MKPRTRAVIGGLLVLLGLIVIDLSVRIVLHIMVPLLGIEIVDADGNKNQKAMIGWTASVMLAGAAISAAGIWISGVRLKFPPKKNRENPN